MSQRKHSHVCITLHQEDGIWKSDTAVNGKLFQGKLPGTVVDQLVDAGGELLSANYIEHHTVLGSRVIMETPDDYKRRHVLWFRFPLEYNKESVQLEPELSS
jgi:hypothetical protein